MLSVATPAASACGAPRSPAPSLNCTVPVGVPAPGAVTVTVAVNVVLCPNTAGLTEEASPVAVAARFTVCVGNAPVLAAKLASPLYSALIPCAAGPKVEVLTWAMPLPFSAIGAPSGLLPSLNCTVPVGVPDPGGIAVTVAVNVTDCPNTEGLTVDVTAVPVPTRLTVCVGSEPLLTVKFASPR